MGNNFTGDFAKDTLSEHKFLNLKYQQQPSFYLRWACQAQERFWTENAHNLQVKLSRSWLKSSAKPKSLKGLSWNLAKSAKLTYANAFAVVGILKTEFFRFAFVFFILFFKYL